MLWRRGKSNKMFETKDLSHPFLRFQSIRGEYSVHEQNITNDLKSQTCTRRNPLNRLPPPTKWFQFLKRRGSLHLFGMEQFFCQIKNTHTGGRGECRILWQLTTFARMDTVRFEATNLTLPFRIFFFKWDVCQLWRFHACICTPVVVFENQGHIFLQGSLDW